MQPFATIDEFLAFWLDGPGNAVPDSEVRATPGPYYGNYQGKFTPYLRGHYRSQVAGTEHLPQIARAPDARA